LAEDTQRYVLKRDALRRGLTSEEEDHAAQLAVAFLAGHSKVLPRATKPPLVLDATAREALAQEDEAARIVCRVSAKPEQQFLSAERRRSSQVRALFPLRAPPALRPRLARSCSFRTAAAAVDA